MRTEQSLVTPFNLLNSTSELNENRYLLIWGKKPSTKKPNKKKKKKSEGAFYKVEISPLPFKPYFFHLNKKSPEKNTNESKDQWNLIIMGMKYTTCQYGLTKKFHFVMKTYEDFIKTYQKYSGSWERLGRNSWAWFRQRPQCLGVRTG